MGFSPGNLRMHLFNNGGFQTETMVNHGTRGKVIVSVAGSGEAGSRDRNVVNAGGGADCFACACVVFLAAEKRGMTRNDVTSDCAVHKP